MYEDSNKELFQYRSYQVDITNPVAFKKSEKEKIIKPQIVLKYENTKKEDDEENLPIDNFPYEFYEETQYRFEEIKEDKIIKEENKIETSKKEEIKNKIKEEPIKEEIQIEKRRREEVKNEEKNDIKQEKKDIKKDIMKEEKKDIKKEGKKEIKKLEKKDIKKDIKKEEKKVEKKSNSKNKEIKKEIKKEEKNIEKSKKEESEKRLVNPRNEEIKKEIKKEEKKFEIPKKQEAKKEENKEEKITEKKGEKQFENPIKEEIKKKEKKEKKKFENQKIEKEKREINKNDNKLNEPKTIKENTLKNELIKETKSMKKLKKEEIRMKKTGTKFEPTPKIQKEKKENQNKIEKKIKDQKINQSQMVDKKIEKSNKNEQKIKEDIIIKPKIEILQIEELKVEPIEYKGFENSKPLKEQRFTHKVQEEKNLNKKREIFYSDKLPKTLLTKKTEDNYDLMIKYLKDNNNLKRNDEEIINGIINYEDFSSDQFLGLVSEKIKADNANKSIIEDFLQRNKDDTKLRQDNNKTMNDRIKLIDESTKKKLYFNNKQSQQDYFDSFYNKQIEYKNNKKEKIDQLAWKYDIEEKEKNLRRESKSENKLDYFKNNEPVILSKYCLKAKKGNNKNNNNEQNVNENMKENGNQKRNIKLKLKKLVSFDQNKSNRSGSNNNSRNNNENSDNHLDNNNNKNNIESKNNTSNNSKNKKLKKIKSGPLQKNKIKLSEKEIEELTNKLHYDGELIKIKKQAIINEDFATNDKYNNFSKEKLTRPSIIILIKKILYEYSTSIKKNAFSDYLKNPKLNYEQYIDILKDLYYLGRESLPEDYLDEDCMYKELWNKLIKFSSGPENSIESNVLLLYLLELNGFFSNEKIIKELKNEIYWIKLEEYDDLLANSKYIEENWNDLKMAKIENIKKLKMEGKYNPIHCDEIYYNNKLINSNGNSNFSNSSINNKTTHYITTLKGETNYHLIHGYNLKNKNENSFLFFSDSLNKNEENKHSSFSLSNLSNKNLKNRIPLKDSYHNLIEKRKNNIENMKKDEEKKLKEICTFKPEINSLNKNIFSKAVKVILPKYKRNKSLNSISKTQTLENNSNYINKHSNENNLTIYNQTEKENNNSRNNRKNLSKYNNHNYLSIKDLRATNSSQSPILKNGRNNEYNQNLKRNRSALQKMFEDNPLKNDKIIKTKIQKLKMARMRNDNDCENINYVVPMRFDIEYSNKFEGIGVNINRESNLKQKTQNVIFYNIKVNDKIKTLKYIVGDDLKLNVINFVRKNQLPEEVTDIILTKIKEKTIEEIL